MSTFIQRAEEKTARARENRRITKGGVVQVFPGSHTVWLDVGEFNQAGAAVYMKNVPYTPTNPPQVGDVVPVEYSGTSNHSVRVGIGRLSGNNSSSGVTVTAANIVNFVRKTGETSGQAGDITLDPGASIAITRSNRTFTIAEDGYDLFFSIEAAPLSSAVLLRRIIARPMTLPISLTGSQGKAGTAATATTDIDLQVNGTSKGTVRWAAAGTAASFIFAAGVALVAGDVVTAVAPGTPDATLAKIAVCLRGVAT